MKTRDIGRWTTFACIVLMLASPVASAQDGRRANMRVGDVNGTWYGWAMGNGLEVKISQYPSELKAFMRAADPGGRGLDEVELTPSFSGEYLNLESARMSGSFRFEGSLLHGTLTQDNEFVTVTLARSMPDVERLFAERVSEADPRGQSSGHIKASSQNNLKQLGLVMKMFANESKGQLFPRLDSRPGHLMMAGSEVFPEYVTDVMVYVSPAHPEKQTFSQQAAQDPLSVVDDHSYWYLGYTVTNEDAGLAFVDAYKNAVQSGEAPSKDLTGTNVGTIMRLREGVERFLITDINDPSSAARIQSELPLMIERPGLIEGGSNVLFMDGHVEFIKYPGKFPMTEKFIEALQSLDQLKE